MGSRCCSAMLRSVRDLHTITIMTLIDSASFQGLVVATSLAFPAQITRRARQRSRHHRSSSCARGERRRKRPRPSFASAPASLQAGWPACAHAASAPRSVRSVLAWQASGSRPAAAHTPGPAHRCGGWRSSLAGSWRCQHDILVRACALHPWLRQLFSLRAVASGGGCSPDRRRRRSGLPRGCRARALGLLAATAGVACRLSLRRGLARSDAELCLACPAKAPAPRSPDGDVRHG